MQQKGPRRSQGETKQKKCLRRGLGEVNMSLSLAVTQNNSTSDHAPRLETRDDGQECFVDCATHVGDSEGEGEGHKY